MCALLVTTHQDNDVYPPSVVATDNHNSPQLKGTINSTAAKIRVKRPRVIQFIRHASSLISVVVTWMCQFAHFDNKLLNVYRIYPAKNNEETI